MANWAVQSVSMANQIVQSVSMANEEVKWLFRMFLWLIKQYNQFLWLIEKQADFLGCIETIEKVDLCQCRLLRMSVLSWHVLIADEISADWQQFSKVSFVVSFYDRLDSELTFENVCVIMACTHCRWNLRRLVEILKSQLHGQFSWQIE